MPDGADFLALKKKKKFFFTIFPFRDVEEELEVVWQAATQENQQMRETLLDSKLSGALSAWALSPDFPAQTSEEAIKSPLLQQMHGLDFYC